MLLPLNWLVKPLRKRFRFHFYGHKQTNNIDKVGYTVVRDLNLNAKGVTPVQMTHPNSKDNGKFSKPGISRKIMTKILGGNFEKIFLE